MRVYNNELNTGLTLVICNCCNKELLLENGILKEECIHVTHDFGFFGQKDGETHSFDLCEECYDKILSKFRIPPNIEERKELL